MVSGQVDGLSEETLKSALQKWLHAQGWQTKIAWGKTHGTDIEATRADEYWIIEVKGHGSRSAMRVNYFLGVLGELLQRMSNPVAKYSVALPDVQQFESLWQKLPDLAKSRTGITVLFIDTDGNVREAS